MTDIVNAIFVRDGSVLLVRRSAHRKAYPSTWSFPGGHVEPGETLEQALIREIGEETTVHPIEFEKLAMIADPIDPNIAYHMFVVTDWKGGAPDLAGDEHCEKRWMSLFEARELNDLAIAAYRQVFDRLRHDIGK